MTDPAMRIDQTVLTDVRSDIMDTFATHSLKVEPPYWQAVFNEHKTFEVRRNDRGFQRAPVAEARRVMEIDWTTRDELAEAIPPYYTEYVGAALLAAIEGREAA